jgi:hypothetical protein
VQTDPKLDKQPSVQKHAKQDNEPASIGGGPSIAFLIVSWSCSIFAKLGAGTGSDIVSSFKGCAHLKD